MHIHIYIWWLQKACAMAQMFLLPQDRTLGSPLLLPVTTLPSTAGASMNTNIMVPYSPSSSYCYGGAYPIHVKMCVYIYIYTRTYQAIVLVMISAIDATQVAAPSQSGLAQLPPGFEHLCALQEDPGCQLHGAVLHHRFREGLPKGRFRKPSTPKCSSEGLLIGSSLNLEGPQFRQ